MAVPRSHEREYQGMLRKARWLLRQHQDVMLLADRGNARPPVDELAMLSANGTTVCAYAATCSCMVPDDIQQWSALCIRRSCEARLYRNVGLWLDGAHRTNLVLATVKGAKESWAVMTDETPSLQTLWQYALRFRALGIVFG